MLGRLNWSLVDEYQDIGAPEYELIAALAGETLAEDDARLNLFAVGDDDQNISLATVRPNRVIQAPEMASVLLMVPVAASSATVAPRGSDSVSVMLSLPSSCASSSTLTPSVFTVSPGPNRSAPRASGAVFARHCGAVAGAVAD